MNHDFAAAYDEHVWEVFGFLGYRVRDRHLAEELTQQTFEKALRAWPRFDPDRAPLGAWLIAIARNVLIDHRRREGTIPRTRPDEVPEVDWGTESLQASLGMSPDLASALESLDEQQRELIALRFGADLTARQVADVTGLSLANVQQILSRSLRKLRAQLEQGPGMPLQPPAAKDAG